MVLTSLKSFLEDLRNHTEYKNIYGLLLSDSDWISVDTLTSTLKPFAIVTKKLQCPSTTLSDFYGMWLNLEMKTKRLSSINTLSRNLLSKMEAFQSILMKTPIIYAALYLDPRYNIVLDDNQKKIAIDLLVSLYHRINTNNPVRSSSTQENLNEAESALDEVSSLINRIRNHNNNPTTISNPSDCNIKQILCNFKDEESLTKSVLLYWEEQKSLKPELYKLANIIFAISPTQASVERAFSALALILTPLRTQMSDKLLFEILLVRLNKSIYRQ